MALKVGKGGMRYRSLWPFLSQKRGSQVSINCPKSRLFQPFLTVFEVTTSACRLLLLSILLNLCMAHFHTHRYRSEHNPNQQNGALIISHFTHAYCLLLAAKACFGIGEDREQYFATFGLLRVLFGGFLEGRGAVWGLLLAVCSKNSTQCKNSPNAPRKLTPVRTPGVPTGLLV